MLLGKLHFHVAAPLFIRKGRGNLYSVIHPQTVTNLTTKALRDRWGNLWLSVVWMVWIPDQLRKWNVCKGVQRDKSSVWSLERMNDMFTHSLLGPVHTRLPDQRVVTELDLVGVHHVPAVCEQDTCSSVARIISHLAKELGSKMRPLWKWTSLQNYISQCALTLYKL